MTTVTCNISTCNQLGVDAGFNREFLASAVESVLMAVVSIFPLLSVLVVCEYWSICLSVSIAESVFPRSVSLIFTQLFHGADWRFYDGKYLV